MTEQSQPNEFVDATGKIRRCGTIPRVPQIPVGAAIDDDQNYLWDDADIRKAIGAKSYTPIMDRLATDGFLQTFTKKANQHTTSACNGWLVANGYTLARFFGGIEDHNVYSGAYNYSLMNGGRDQGSVLEDGYGVSSRYGHVTVEECPWSQIWRDDTKKLDASAATRKAADPYPVRTWQGLKTGIAKGGLGGVAIMAGSQTAASKFPPVVRGPGNHAVVSLGVENVGGKLFLPTYLDWGPDQGEGGFVWLTEDHFNQTIGNHFFWIMPYGQRGLGV